MYFDANDLLQQFDPGTLRRGEAYARDGRVLAVRWQGERLAGEVGGSGAAVYRQSIRILEKYGEVAFDGNCTCPVTHNCKHVVAVLVDEIARRAREFEASAAPTIVGDYWLVQLALLREAAPCKPSPFSLGWILAPDARNDLITLHLRKVRPDKRGGIGATTDDLDPNALLRDPPAWLAPGQSELLRLFCGLGAGTASPGAARPEGRLGAGLLRRLCATGQLLRAATQDDLRRGRVITMQAGEARAARLDWHPAPDDAAALQLGWLFVDGAARAPDGMLPTEPPCYLDGELLGECALPAALAQLPLAKVMRIVADAPRLEAGQRGAMAARMAMAGLDALVPLPHALQIRERSDVVPVPWLILDSMLVARRGDHVWLDHACLNFHYDGRSTDGVDEPVLREVAGDTVDIIVRNAAAEAAAATLLAELGFRAPAAGSPLRDIPGALHLADDAAWVDFARRGMPRLQAAGWAIEFNGNYRYELAEVDHWYAEIEEQGEGGAWFSLDLGIVVGGERHALLPLLVKMIRAAPRDFAGGALAARADDDDLVIALDDGVRVAVSWGRIKPILTTLGELYFGEHGAWVYLPSIDAARLAELERAAQLRWMGGERLRELGRKLAAFDGIADIAPPAGLQARLRPYQRSGVAWLQFLREYELGGILADDMGLGKTIQTLAHILLEKEAGRLDAPALVIAPTSLMPNWQAEAARFAPGLCVLLLHGAERGALFDTIGQADLVLTTYALLARDEAALRRHRFHLLILDEAQYIKNSRSKAAQSARLIDARHRLCLTGTPVQNHLGELWSQFHFLMPGLLGELKSFNANYRKPIEQEGNVERKDFLVRRLKPFMLRRTKDKVATELPPKTEIVLPVELGGTQRDLYETVRVAMHRKVRAEIDRKGLASSHIVILEALLKLRQVCCDPRLLAPENDVASAKLEALMELLETLMSEGRKVLVFSQFTSMLALIQDALRARAIDFVLLTGSTEDRAAPVAAFQAGTVGVFLISLKAGGVGLNLTAADTVIHYDPWWNPASENQATDRAWRIGQTQPVFVYKLIARGTLEEKIQELQRRKGELADAMLANDSELAPTIGADDLRAIFAPH